MSNYILIQKDFDNMENRDAETSKNLSVFYDDEETAYKKVCDYLARMPKQQMYLGWNNEIYPKFKLEMVP